MNFNSTNIPQEIKAINHWFAWRLEVDKDNPKKPKKVPINPHTGGNGMVDTPSTCGSYNEAYNRAFSNASQQGLQIGGNHGVGFLFTSEDPYIGIDLDYVILEDGSIKPFAAEIVNLLDSYTEYSPSQHGLHIIIKADCQYSELNSRNKNPELGLEVYGETRFLTVTGQVYGEHKTIAERTEALKTICAKYLAKSKKESSTETVQYRHTDRSNSDLWQIAFNNPENGKRIRALYDGDFSGYGSHSEADLALCNHLAFWTRKDPQQMDSMFRESALMRDKWDEVHNNEGQTYGQITIQNAIANTRNVFDPKPQTTSTPQTSTSLPQVGGAHGEKILSPLNAWGLAHPTLEPPQHVLAAEFELVENLKQADDTLASYLDSQLMLDIDAFKAFKNRKSGFANIDKFNSLYPGLYAVGGVSGVGKTTFCHQLADNLAKAGDYVLFFSLEQTRFELASKGLARLAALENLSSNITALDIRNGRISSAVQRAIGTYKDFARRIRILEARNFDINTIAIAIEDFITKTGVKPVVFIDYLQIIAPATSKGTTKEAIDANVNALKNLQSKHGLVMFVVSSFNRTNYLNIADFESFKESGLIEYSADVVWALQLLAMNAQIFDKQNKLQSKRNFVHEAKNAEPRKIELLCLKNRYGRSYARYFFDYFPQLDLFTPYDVTPEQADSEIQEAFDAFEPNHGDSENGKNSKKRSI